MADGTITTDDIQFKSDDPDLLTIGLQDGMFTIVGVGKVNIIATKQGVSNQVQIVCYNPFASITAIFKSIQKVKSLERLNDDRNNGIIVHKMPNGQSATLVRHKCQRYRLTFQYLTYGEITSMLEEFLELFRNNSMIQLPKENLEKYGWLNISGLGTSQINTNVSFHVFKKPVFEIINGTNYWKLSVELEEVILKDGTILDTDYV